MVDIQKNEQVNGELRALYQQYAEAYLSAYRAAFHDPEPPHRINEFGIIDVKQYDGDKGILFIAKETNGWDNADYKADRLFRSWVNGIARNGLAGKGHVGRHPGMWYNLGRWAAYLNGTNRNIDQIKTYKREALQAIGTVAFTNLNKVRGRGSSGKEYWALANADISGRLLRAELDILRPKIVVCCGTSIVFRTHIELFPGAVISMPHPAARMGSTQMLRRLEEQTRQPEDILSS